MEERRFVRNRITRTERMAKIAQFQMDLYHNLHKREEYIFQSSIDIGADCEIFGITLYNKENPDGVIVRKKNGNEIIHISMNCLSDELLSMIYDILKKAFE